MQYNIKTINSIHIDFLVAFARDGGGENVMNALGSYLVSLGFSVRIVQFTQTDLDWADSSMEIVYIYNKPEDHDLSDYCEEYKKILMNGPSPDLILAVAMPYMSYVAKRTTMELNIDATVVSYLHAGLQNYINAGFGGGKALACADAHLAISNYIKNDIEQVVENPICYRVNNPLDMDPEAIPANMNPLKLCYVGRLSVEKKVETIISAVSKSAYPYELYIVGDGDQKEVLENLSRKLGISGRIHFLGFKPTPWDEVKECATCILASEYEGFSLTSIEAMARGKSVIGTPVSGVIELVKPGKNGYIFPIDGDDELANILDMMASKAFPAIDPDFCKDSIIPFYKDKALGDIALKIFSLSQKRVLPYKDVYLPKVSVIIPCYNCSDTIRRCLDSILNSSLGLRSLEIIAVNDASTDDTFSILMEYENRYPENFLVINCEKNGKQGKARNIGLSYASGDFISFVDSDDFIDTNMLLKLVIYAQTFETDVAECDYEQFDQLSTILPKQVYVESDNLQLNENDADAVGIFRQNMMVPAIWKKIYRRSFLKNKDILFPEGIFMEDVFFSQVLTCETKSIYKTNEKLYNYFISPNSTMRSDKLRNYYMDVFYSQKLAIEEITKRGFFDTLKDPLRETMTIRSEDIKNYMLSLGEFSKENLLEIDNYLNSKFPT